MIVGLFINLPFAVSAAIFALTPLFLCVWLIAHAIRSFE